MTLRSTLLLTLSLLLAACDGSSGTETAPDTSGATDVASVDLSLPEDAGAVPEDAATAGCEDDEACLAAFAAAGEEAGPCRDAHCGDDGQCVWLAHEDDAVCDDGDPCTEDTTCQQGACLGRYVCAACEATDDCASLEDGNPCNGTLRCVSGQCELDPDTVVTCEAPEDPCRRSHCNVTTGACVVADAPDGTLCDDEDVCTVDDRCRNGTCHASVRACDDGDACTHNACTPEDGCVYTPVSCDDEDACTIDSCDPESGCQWQTRSCDDRNLCTIDACDPAFGCRYTALDCDDGDACTVDTCRPGSGCAHREVLCDDGDPLTDDACDPGTGQCVNASPQCDDDDPCTVDSWDADAGECRHWARSCNDGDPCTVETCESDSGCVYATNDCDDGEPCTGTTCTAYVGCDYEPLSGGTCDDGRDCSTGDVCVDGVCQGDESDCVCLAPAGPAIKLTSLQIGASGNAGQGLDIDGDPLTCAPANNCSEGVDNALAAAAAVSNPEITGAFDAGDVFLLIQHEGFRPAGRPDLLNGWLADPADGTCAHQTARCAYWLDPRVFDDECNPSARMTDATLSGGVLQAGGPGSTFSFEFPLVAGVDLAIVLHDARIEGTVTLDANDEPATMSGILAGAIRKDDLRATLLSIPADQLPLDVSFLLTIIDNLLVEDIDTDGDGADDAISAGLLIEGIAADILGTFGE